MRSSDNMMDAVILWVAFLALALLGIATLLPLLPTGVWLVRLCDFPRVQLVVLLLVPLIAVNVHALRVRSVGADHLVLLTAIVLIAGWQLAHVAPFTPLWPSELPHEQHGDALRLMVANVEVDNSQRAATLHAIQQQDADLLLIIEIDSAWRKALNDLVSEYPYRIEAIRGEGLGMALWSKFPLHDPKVEYLVSDRRPSIFAAVELPDGRRTQFAGVHPTPPGLKDATQGGRRDSRVRDAELVFVANRVQDSPAPWIVAGDFNDVAWSHTTRLFKRLSGLSDPRVGRSLLNTYHADYPLLRYPIDQVFLSQGSTIDLLSRVRLPGSDHFALVSDFFVDFTGPSAEASPQDEAEARTLIKEGDQDAEQRDVDVQKDDVR